MHQTPLIGAEELIDALGRADAPLVIDVTVGFPPARFDGDYRPESGAAAWRAAHIPGSRHVDLLTAFSDTARNLHFSRPDASRFADELAALGMSAGIDVVVYDQGSMTWAARVWWLLRSVGVAARVLDGGLARWTRLGLPREFGDAVPPNGTTPERGLSYLPLWVDRAEVSAIVAGQAPGTLVCALAPAQFAGTDRTRYSRRGHIPDSRNLPAKALLGEDGLVRNRAELRGLAADALAGAEPPLVLYCGGGVSACLTALGLVLAGYDDVQVYDGSLEEWSADPGLPMSTTADGDA
ncbi:sulfurtransferase [Rhodococcus sp. NPDC054953]